MTDYDRIAKAISYINERVSDQPTLEEISAHLHMSPFHFQRVFCRWAGVTPKKYLQILTVERAKKLLSESRSLLEVSDSLGLSSGSRLYDHFIHLEAVTPGEFKKKGLSLTIEYAIHTTPFGKVFIAVTQRGVCKFSFIGHGGFNEELDELRKKWPHAVMCENIEGTLEVVESMFLSNLELTRPLSFVACYRNEFSS